MLPPQSRFGSVPLQLIRRQSEKMPDWRPDLRVVNHHYAGGNVNDVEVIGQGRLQLTALVRLATPELFERFLGLIGTEQTLHVSYFSTAFPGDRDGEDVDGIYKEFDRVLLRDPEDIQRRPGGLVDLTVTFERDPR